MPHFHLPLLLITLLLFPGFTRGDESALLGTIAERCATCHAGSEPAGRLSLENITAVDSLKAQPALLHKLLKAVDSGAMPPETEPPLPLLLRQQTSSQLGLLLSSAAHVKPAGAPVWRMNRFQYNNAVRDLFLIRQPVLPLPEILMTRSSNWLQPNAAGTPPTTMPPEVQARCDSLTPQPGLAGVNAFPADLRAEHGFDNQADQLTMSPLLLDAFLRLSFSIVDSPDFNPRTVGLWQDFFSDLPPQSDLRTEIERRLQVLLRRAFRRPVQTDSLNRYASFAYNRCLAGDALPEAMKKTAAAILSSPAFLFHVRETQPQDPVRTQHVAAAQLALFLWGSIPDQELLDLADQQRLSDPAVQTAQIDRLLADARIERFLDAFPAQWLQLQNVLAATPDPARAPWFKVDPQRPASLHMVLEPLLLFDRAFLENQPLSELVNPEFTYRSQFLQSWYGDRLQPEPVDVAAVAEQNQRQAERRQQLQTQLQQHQDELRKLLRPVREQLLVASGVTLPAAGLSDAQPMADWNFEGSLSDSVQGLNLTAHGDVRFDSGRVILDGAWLQSPELPDSLAAKSFEVRFLLRDLDQPGGGLMGIEGPGSVFDTLVLGERRPRHWISGSNNFSRTLDFPADAAETVTDQELHLVLVYQADGTTQLYRNGAAWGQSYRKGQHTFPAGQSRILLGLRHLPAGGNRGLRVELAQARLYDFALTAEQAAEAAAGRVFGISRKALQQALTDQQQRQRTELESAVASVQQQLAAVPPDVTAESLQQQRLREFTERLRQQLQDSVFTRLPVTDERFGGIIANAAMLSMTTGPDRTHPVARGAWISGVIFNDPPPPPPNDIPPLNESAADKSLTIREQFAEHRRSPSCAGCHSRLDPLGFALENYDIVGRWRDRYDNGREIDASGTLLRLHEFTGAVQFRRTLAAEQDRIAHAFVEHLLRFALTRPLQPADQLTVRRILQRTAAEHYPVKSLIRETALALIADQLQ